jgi:hypothetical protein
MSNDTPCTHGPSAVTGERCGRPAVVTFIGSDGRHYAECPEHDASAIVMRDTTEQVGQPYTIRRYGKEYAGKIVYITNTRLQIEFTYDNGAVRRVWEPRS